MFRKVSDFIVLRVFPFFQFKTAGKALGLIKTLTFDDRTEAFRILKANKCIVLTYEEGKLSSWLINLSSKILSKNSSKYGKFSHVTGNIDVNLARSEFPIVFVEATSSGVHLSDFFEVFNVNAACILFPKHCSGPDWYIVTKEVFRNIGKKYDTMFNPNDEYFSCAELWLDGIKECPDWRMKFPGMARLVDSGKNITPEMFALSEDFHIVYNVRR